jgi:hypothetical protein
MRGTLIPVVWFAACLATPALSSPPDGPGSPPGKPAAERRPTEAEIKAEFDRYREDHEAVLKELTRLAEAKMADDRLLERLETLRAKKVVVPRLEWRAGSIGDVSLFYRGPGKDGAARFGVDAYLVPPSFDRRIPESGWLEAVVHGLDASKLTPEKWSRQTVFLERFDLVDGEKVPVFRVFDLTPYIAKFGRLP